jgi:hypothetical protein
VSGDTVYTVPRWGLNGRDSIVLAIDPGPMSSGVVKYDRASKRVTFASSEVPNDDVFGIIRDHVASCGFGRAVIVLEKVQNYGMAVGEDVFETIDWSGRFRQFALDLDGGALVERITRPRVKAHLCRSTAAGDAEVNQAIWSRFGGAGGRKAAIGTKKEPGPIFGVTGHATAALAVAVTFADIENPLHPWEPASCPT